MSDRIHAQFTHRPSTLRLSCVNPNLQNIEKGSRFRTVFVAAKDCVLLEADFSAIEAVLTGWCVGDKDFIRLAKLGIHDYHGAAVFGRYHDLSLPDIELGRLLAQEKEILGTQRDKSKRTIYGTLYGMSAPGLHKTYPELFPSVKLAAENQELLHRLLPKLKEWQNATRLEAAKKNYLGGANHPFHYKHWFWDVFSYDKTGAMKLGADSKRVVAYYPQSIAAGIIKESALRLVEQGPYYIGDWFFGKTPIRALIHDSIVLEIPKNLLDRALEKIVGAMTMPNPQLPCPAEWRIGTHLSIGVAVKVGEDWKNMSKVGLPEIGTASETAVVIEEEGQEI
jgi:DNA polymerase I-like protein with 3'-5' exonuclease and polymerase domains